MFVFVVVMSWMVFFLRPTIVVYFLSVVVCCQNDNRIYFITLSFDAMRCPFQCANWQTVKHRFIPSGMHACMCFFQSNWADGWWVWNAICTCGALPSIVCFDRTRFKQIWFFKCVVATTFTNHFFGHTTIRFKME